MDVLEICFPFFINRFYVKVHRHIHAMRAEVIHFGVLHYE